MEALFLSSRGTPVNWVSVEQVFKWPTRFQILCTTPDEVDELTALCLVFGREVSVMTLHDWHKKEVLHRTFNYSGDTPSGYTHAGPAIRLLPQVFTTFEPGSKLRGL